MHFFVFLSFWGMKVGNIFQLMCLNSIKYVNASSFLLACHLRYYLALNIYIDSYRSKFVLMSTIDFFWKKSYFPWAMWLFCRDFFFNKRLFLITLMLLALLPLFLLQFLLILKDTSININNGVKEDELRKYFHHK